MGKHLIPQAYLRQFTTDGSGGIHVFDVEAGAWRGDGRPLPVSKVAQLRDVWSDEVESELTHIEATGFPVLKQLSNKSDVVLSDEERGAAACYIASMLGLRSPGMLDYFKPSMLNRLKGGGGAEDATDEKERAEIADWSDHEREEVEKGPYRGRAHFRGELAPWISPGVFDCIAAMRWTVLSAERGDFVTSDTPVGMGDCGLGLRAGRAWMPLSPERLLLMDWASEKHEPSKTSVLRWMPCRQVSRYNRLMVAGAFRELFCRRPYGWVERATEVRERSGLRHREAGPSARERRRREKDVECVECGLPARNCGCSLGFPTFLRIRWTSGRLGRFECTATRAFSGVARQRPALRSGRAPSLAGRLALAS